MSNFVSPIDSIIKCVGFKSNHYVIDLDDILFFIICSEFDCVCIDVLVLINKIIYPLKNHFRKWIFFSQKNSKNIPYLAIKNICEK